MTYTNYHKGRKREYKIVNELKAEGYDEVQRTAGSHSPFDIFAIRYADNVLKLVQVKPKTMSDKAKQKLLDNNKHLTDMYKVKFEVR